MSAARPRARELALEIERSTDPLPEIARALRKRFSAAGIVAVGLGMRRHDKRRGRPLSPEPTVKILLRRKLDPLPRGVEPLPEWLVLRSRWLGRPFRVRIRTDIEERPRAAVTQFQIRAPAGGSLCTAAYARWTAGGKQRSGVVTAGHGLWPSPKSAGPAANAPVELGPVCDDRVLPGRVVCASHLKRDCVDAALLELPSFDPCLFSMWQASIEVPTVPRLLDRLGAEIDDGLSIESTFRHFALSPTGVRAVALFREFPLSIAGGWGSCKLEDVVEFEAAPDTFLAGTSGSGLVSKGPAKLALSIQSLCLDHGPPGATFNRRGVGTSFIRAIRWLREKSGHDIELFWRVPPP